MIDREFTNSTKQDFVDACEAQDVSVACALMEDDFVRNCEMQAQQDHSKFLARVLTTVSQDESNNDFVKGVLEYVQEKFSQSDTFLLAARDGASITDNAELVNYVDAAMSSSDVEDNADVAGADVLDFNADDDVDPDAWSENTNTDIGSMGFHNN